ncbi:TM2 domain-containing protein [Actinokineospora diospyrosa]|uniref:TM2 domain-containing protein n=1 Tax=Actinokineospora diospyrosa TaxID=103728 RepID=A0ABT1IM60_9PSEU|nr:TM2 domain-containing protein [Actinokineospora diospyrosa]
MRVGTTEREDAMRALGEHFAQGRLPMDEYEQRVGAAADAVTRGDLRELFTDLPAPHPPFLVPPTWAAPAPVAMPSYPQPYPPHMPAPYVEVYSHRSKVVAGLLQILVPFGAGRFYTGHYGIAVAQLLTCGGFGIWCLIDGVVLLVSGGLDAEGRRLRD